MNNYSNVLATLIDLGMGDWYEVPYDADIPAGVTFAEVYAPGSVVSQVRMVPNSSGLEVDARAMPGQEGYTYWTPSIVKSPIDWQRWVDEAKRSGCGVEIGGIYIQTVERWRQSVGSSEPEDLILLNSVKDIYNAGA